MILVTGSAGFIGSHMVRALETLGESVLGSDPRVVEAQMFSHHLTAVFHLGAISDTTCEDAEALQLTNVHLSAKLALFAAEHEIPFIYASSASVYGNDAGPLNKYAWSKWDFDDWMQDDGGVRPRDWYGLRFFNVYGPGEDHKGTQASMPFQFCQRVKRGEKIEFFAPKASRDFVHVEDVVAVLLWLWKTRPASGIYDIGTGVSRSFMELADIVIAATHPQIKFITNMPSSLEGKYQEFTQADLTKLRAAGYDKSFLSLEDGIARMLA